MNTKPINAMTQTELVAIARERAKLANIEWEKINAAAMLAMNAQPPSANLITLRQYMVNK